MCIPGVDPLTAAMVAATAGGALYNADTQQNAIEEQNRQNRDAMEMERAARLAEAERQQDLEALQLEAVSRALVEVDPAQSTAQVEDVAGPASEIATSADLYNLPALQGQLTEGAAPSSIGRIVSQALDKTRGILGAQSILSGQNTERLASQDALVRMAGDVQNTGSLRQGSLNASRRETFVPAAQVTPSSSPLGDILMLGGVLGSGRAGRAAAKRAFAPGLESA